MKASNHFDSEGLGVRHSAVRNPRLWHPVIWPSLLSLDAPLIAVLWQLLFARALHMRLPISATVVLAMVLWLIYVADRVLDSFQESDSEEAARHRFYRLHRGAYAAPFAAVLAVTSWMAWKYIRPDVRRDGLLLMLVILAYFALVHALPPGARRWFPKELAVALLFALGTCLPVGVRIEGEGAVWFVLPLLLFASILWMNALFIEYSEWIRPRGAQADRPHRLTIVAGKYFRALSAGIGAVAVCAMMIKVFRVDRPVLLAEALSVVALQGLDSFRAMVPIDVVGAVADAALLAPGILLLFWGR